MKHQLTRITALLLAPLAALHAADSTPSMKPNVLFICTDQQHAGMLGSAGNLCG